MYLCISWIYLQVRVRILRYIDISIPWDLKCFLVISSIHVEPRIENISFWIICNEAFINHVIAALAWLGNCDIGESWLLALRNKIYFFQLAVCISNLLKSNWIFFFYFFVGLMTSELKHDSRDVKRFHLIDARRGGDEALKSLSLSLIWNLGLVLLFSVFWKSRLGTGFWLLGFISSVISHSLIQY